MRYAASLGLEPIWQRVHSLAALLRARLAEIPGVTICDRGRTQCGIVGFLCQGIDAEVVKAALARERINVSVSDAPWTRIDMDGRGIPSLVRASVHYYNSEEELEALAAAVAALLRGNGATAA